MMDKFWESLSGDLAEEWLKRAFSPPFLFWLLGLLLYVSRYGWQDLWQRLANLTLVEQIALLGLALLGLILSSLLTSRWQFTLLRWLEGYWPWPLHYLEGVSTAWQAGRLAHNERKLNALLSKRKPLSALQTRQRADLEIFTHYFPAESSAILSTRLGNILRAGETAPAQKYGLDAFVCWPRLWPLLPENLRRDLTAIRENLLVMAEVWGLGMLSVIWVIWSWWALPVALVWMLGAYRLTLSIAMAYADMIESAFDLYRRDLYTAVDWPFPEEKGDAEIAAGKQLTEFLWRGILPD